MTVSATMGQFSGKRHNYLLLIKQNSFTLEQGSAQDLKISVMSCPEYSKFQNFLSCLDLSLDRYLSCPRTGICPVLSWGYLRVYIFVGQNFWTIFFAFLLLWKMRRQKNNNFAEASCAIHHLTSQKYIFRIHFYSINHLFK